MPPKSLTRLVGPKQPLHGMLPFVHMEKYFNGTSSRIEGIGLETLARESQMKHDYAFQPPTENDTELDIGGSYQFRERGEYHLFNPTTISKLQHAVRSSSYETFRQYSDAVNNHNRQLAGHAADAHRSA